MGKFIMIKAIESLEGLKYMEESCCSNGEMRYFNITGSESDKDIVRNLSEAKYPLYILVFSDTNEGKYVKYIYLGLGERSVQGIENEKISIKAYIQRKINDRAQIDNFLDCSEVDLTQDFESGSYITFEDLPSLVKQMSFIAKPPYRYTNSQPKKFCHLADEERLFELAQRNEYCIREYSGSGVSDFCGEYQRDYNQIVQSKAFRRMVDKAQIFSAEKGDHYRMRLTHTITVNQIAKSISNALKLNSFLTEAIALGHDIGHTPFGHQGERTLNAILTCEENSVLVMKDQIKYGGFKHNYHSLRVATRLEESDIGYDGLNLSFQTLDGIWKHTKTNLPEDYLKDFVASRELREFLMKDKSIPCTLEGQVVRIADEIAQRSHDLDDAFAAESLSISELKDYLSLSKMNALNGQIDGIKATLNEAKAANRLYANEVELLYGRISLAVIDFFIEDTLRQSNMNIEKFRSENGASIFSDEGYVFFKTLIDFSNQGKKLCEYLEKIISKKVINSSEVSLFDNNGAAMIESLFRSYYNNPRLLHEGTLHRIMQDFRENNFVIIDVEEGDPSIVESEWRKIINAKADKDEYDSSHNEYHEKNNILVRNITDYIAGMTDSYAKNEYNRIQHRW